MSPSPGDEQQPPEAKSSGGSGGLTGVLKGLAGGAKRTKSNPALQQPSAPVAASHALAERSDTASVPSALHGLSPEQVELVGQLKTGQLSERVAAAHSLRFAISDFPLNPVRDPLLPPSPLSPGTAADGGL